MLLNQEINCDRVWLELDGLIVVQSRVIPDGRVALASAGGGKP